MAITPAVPAPAASVGYNTLTLGPRVAVASGLATDLGNWYKFNFFGNVASQVTVTVNDDGSILLYKNASNSYAAMLSSAQFDQTKSPYIKGIAFGGGAYFEAIMSMSLDTQVGGGTFWCNDIERMAGFSAGDHTLAQWPGQAVGYCDAVEIDFAEFDAGMFSQQYGTFAHDFYGVNLEQPNVGFGHASTVPINTDFAHMHRYGFLWVPATPTSKGTGTWYFDRQPVGAQLTWDLFNPANPPPPTSPGSAFSQMDQKHLALILGNFGTNPVCIQAVSVWQASTAHNIVV